MAVKNLVGTIVCGLCPTLMLSAPVLGQPSQDRVSATEKGSLLIWSKVEIKWNSAGVVTQDTFLQLTNDSNLGVQVHMYFINGDPPLPLVPGVERAHPGWNWIDNEFFLTPNQPIYWSALTGAPMGFSSFTVLDPTGLGGPGRPDLDPGAPLGSRYLRGYIVAWAVDNEDRQISHNHLAGNATLVNYAEGSAWEYNAWSFQCINQTPGALCGDPGIIKLDGVGYAPSFDLLLMNFQAVGASAFTGPKMVLSDTDLTLHLVSADLRQDTFGPKTTKAKFDVWNMNEVKFSGAERCITCWYQALLGTWAPNANHFLRQNLQTDVGKARIDGLASQICDVINPDFNPLLPVSPQNQPWLVLSTNESLLGVIATRLVFDGMAVAVAGTNLHGMGTQSATILYDVQVGVPPTLEEPIQPEQIINNTITEINTQLRSKR